jgi:YD repeat-containing protein
MGTAAEKMTSQLGGRRTFAFDAVDNVTKITDRLGRSREFVYDNLDRTTSEV